MIVSKLPIISTSMKLRLLGISIVLAILGMATQFGCNSAPGVGGPGQFDYQISATLIQDPNIDSSRILVKVSRNLSDYAYARLVFGTDILNFSTLKYGFDSLFYFSKSNTPGYATGSRNLILDDSPNLKDTVLVTVADTFRITVVNDPVNRILRPGNTVTYTWSGSTNASDYVMAAVLADSTYRGYGYSEYLPVIGTSGTLPVEAFSVSASPNMDTGLYNIYVYAITGVPDSTLTSKLLPVPLPLQFPNNISTPDLVGRVGSIQVTLIDTVRAQTIP